MEIIKASGDKELKILGKINKTKGWPFEKMKFTTFSYTKKED